MSDKPERIDIPTGGSLLEAFRALREFLAEQARANGRELDPGWYDDGPESRPGLYPHLRKKQKEEDA